jgi:SpoVK/Ycf46/Vps4 family AAA+-type ATPase
MNPTRINNFNKFLTTLDNYKPVRREENEKLPDSEEKMTDEDINNEINIIIKRINTNFNSNNISNSFTGNLASDYKSIHETHDPNRYFEFFTPLRINENFCFNPIRNKQKNKKTKINADTILQDEDKSESKNIIHPEEVKYININEEINCINDILKLIKMYQLDPYIKYNIDMAALHNIKEPLEELNNMIGMTDLKSNIVDQILYFVQNLHKNKNLSGEFLHTVIYGPPGTGKTEIAKIMGKIYSKIGVLSNGTFKKVTRSDLIAGYLGQTALKTRDVIKEAIGGVLFIDEAYSLGNPEKRDSFAKECIDTLCEALSDNKENLMVIIAGYETELRDNFFTSNQGLDSRFTWRFKIDDYSAEDLYRIYLKKVDDIGWKIYVDEMNANSSNSKTKKIDVEWFEKNKDIFKFYGRDIETLLSKTKIAHSRRVFCLPENEKKIITIEDLDKGFEIYLKNDDIKKKKEAEDLKKQIYYTLYS